METRDIVKLLAGLRQRAEEEAEVSCLEIETTLGLALIDVCEALCLGPSQIRDVVGAEAFDAVYSQAVPVTLPGDQWAELREQVRAVYARSSNVVIDDPAIAFQEAFCQEPA